MTNATELMIQAVKAIQETSLDRKAVSDIVEEKLSSLKPESAITREDVENIFSEALAKAIDAIPPREIRIDVNGAKQNLGAKHMHAMFETVLKACVAGCTPLLVGPAGSGKSTLAKQVAKALGRDFYTQGPATSEYKYLGFVDAQGRLVETPLLKAYRDGGVFCAEEIDASSASALVAGLNMVLANGEADFGNQIVKRHEDFVCICTANTWGKGADRQYVGRNQLDAATLDRFVPIHIDYDEGLERLIAQNDRWVDFVQAARRASVALGVRVVISPRASIQGAHLLRAGIAKQQVADMTVWRGMDNATRNKIREQIKTHKPQDTTAA